ncbi:hypothetical protein CEP52_001418 [Fusarium oligoseptatum]|uniref:Zn(2)-C6 fungal-type domain-containing protein n=1 Tax=Fusarium oligoseptatum TaxID=2604345 RepID=A0A428UJ89_9HYPO|nr:hypothetical protein CEP52_001418 [Fusarium oligoseptatum]
MTRTSTKATGSGSSAATARRSVAGRPCKARSLACRECRDRKIRCDGARPVCDSCCRRGLGADQCVYPEIEHEGSIASSRSYIRALQKRVQELEEKEKQLELAAQGRDAFAATTPSHDDAWRKQSSSPGAVSEQPSRPVKPLDHVLPPIHGDSNYPLSGFPAGAMAQEPAGYYSHPHHMGASPPLTDDLEEASHAKASSFGSYSSNVKAALMLEKISLPPADLMDELLAEYFDVDWITLPAVHRPTFYQRYHRLIAVANSRYRRDIPLEEATELAATYSLLLGMLAIGQLTKSPAESTTSQASNAYEFHQQARPLLLIDLLSVASLPVVQALIIHARFLRRMGHKNSPGNQTPTNFGTLPEEIDDEYLETVPHNPRKEQPSNSPSRISFFTQVLKLSDMVLQPVQATYFNQKQGSKQSISEILGTALNLDCVLEEWQAALPEHLRLKFPCTQTEAVFRRQATLLRMRYLETKALISRAAIMKLVSSQTSQPASMVARSMLSGLFESCYAASVELEDIMNRERRLVTFDGPPESHAVISLCIIGMTLTMLSKHPLFRDIVTNPTPINDEVRRCLVTARQYMTSHHTLAEKFIHALETALQPPSRGPSSPGVLDPALEAKSVGPVLSNLTENPGAVELEVLEAWYNREQGLASGCGMLVSEIVSLW